MSRSRDLSAPSIHFAYTLKSIYVFTSHLSYSKEITNVDTAGEKKVVGHLREVELHDKIRPLQLLGQHEGLFTEKVELN